MAGCGCDRRCEKLLYWLGWRKQRIGPPAMGSYCFETPKISVAIPVVSVRFAHTRAAVVGLLVRWLYGLNRVEGRAVPVWRVDREVSHAEQKRHVRQSGETVETLSQGAITTTWGAQWFPVFRPQVSVLPPVAFTRTNKE